MVNWNSLSAELRFNILEIVADDFDCDSEPYARAGYAIVCREWQPIFEYWNFKRLVLNQDRIFGLEKFMGGNNQHRRWYLEHVSLYVRLDDYNCDVCQLEEDAETIERNNNAFSKAIWELLVVLSRFTTFRVTSGSRFGPPWGRRKEGISLELGAYSPGDSKHTFRDFHLEQDYPYQKREEPLDHPKRRKAYQLRLCEVAPGKLNDPYHGWVNGQREKDTSLESKKRIIGTPLTVSTDLPEFSAFNGTLPKVEVVKDLLIPRRFYRKIEAKSLAKILQESLNCVYSFRHEMWRDVNPQQQTCFEEQYAESVSGNLPDTLKRLYIYEELKLLTLDRTKRHANASLGQALSKSSRSLQILSVAHIVDAEDFFSDFWPGKQQNSETVPWKNLQTLLLTTRMFLRCPRPGRGRRMKELLIAASRAATFMPKLRAMEIWNTEEDGHYCVFSYRGNSILKPSIDLKCTWSDYRRLDYDVTHCWQNLPRHKGYPHDHLRCRDFLTKRNHIPGKPESYIQDRYLLTSFAPVLDKTSHDQLEWEERHPQKELCLDVLDPAT